jgi:molybdopterin synthase catalytic subunit
MAVNARLEPHALVPQRELAELVAQAGGDGAVVSFVGLARSKGSDGKPVETLVLEHHPVMTLKSLEEIAADALSRFGVSHVWVVHRYGSVPPAEPIVFAAAAAPHRRAAFEAADYLMDRLKTEAVFWKREEGTEGSRWIEPTDSDRRDHERWRT